MTSQDVDIFHLFLIKEGRKELKRYGPLFTGLASRAGNVECTSCMYTDSFIQALGSDSGSNFGGA